MERLELFTDRDVRHVMVHHHWDETEARIYLLGVQQGYRMARWRWAAPSLVLGFLGGLLLVLLLTARAP